MSEYSSTGSRYSELISGYGLSQYSWAVESPLEMAFTGSQTRKITIRNSVQAPIEEHQCPLRSKQTIPLARVTTGQGIAKPK
jgi:hypothetical protein